LQALRSSLLFQVIRERELIDYRVAKDTEAEYERTKQRLLAEKGVNDMVAERLKLESAHMEKRERLIAELHRETELKLL
jgi:hypothetical protein